MLHKENMIKHRRGLVIEALMRIIIMVVLVFIVWKIGSTAYSAAFGSGNILNDFEDFAEKINSAQFKAGEVKQELLTLDKGTAVIGFSKGFDYECYGCGGPKDKIESRFKRPADQECQGSACICMCLKGLPEIRGSQQTLEITCENIVCKKIKDDITPKVELGELVKKKYGSGYNQFSSWEGGFLFSRDTGEADAAMSGLPKNYNRKITVTLEKKIVNGSVFVGVCPESPCVQENII